MSHTRKMVDEKTGETHVERVIFTPTPMGFFPHTANYPAHHYSQMTRQYATDQANDKNQDDNCTPSCTIF